MSQSTAATVPPPSTRSPGDPPPLASPEPTATQGGPRNNVRHSESEAPPQPPPQAYLPSSVAMAVLEHWAIDQQNAAATSASQAAGSPNPLATTQQPPPSFSNPQAPFRQAQESWLRSTMSSMGIGRGATPTRKSEMSLAWNLGWGFAQVAVVSTLVALTNTIWKSTSEPSRTEWEACDRPLGVWACLWIARVLLSSGLAYWDFVRTRTARQLQVPSTVVPGAPNPVQLPQPTPRGPQPFDPEVAADPANPPPAVQLPWSHLYARLTLFSSLLTLSWFLTAHILQYTSLNTCRHTSPHLWWLIFGILCIMYVMVLEVLLLGFIVLILAPILFVFWNIFLFCIGRHPAQNPHMIKPDIGKLPKSLVDRIPLVMYIPPPPGSSDTDNKEDASQTPNPLLPADGDDQHQYPPKSPTPPNPKKNRFRFFKRKSQKDAKDATEGSAAAPHTNATDDGEKEHETWEGTFEKNEYPFVVLEGNRAACAICLMDFEEPKRKHAPTDVDSTPVAATAGASTSSSPTSDNGELKLTDAGEGAQPLRLLACGHVFHQTCLDPWLTDVSGRCPVCQRPVEARELKKRKRGNH